VSGASLLAQHLADLQEQQEQLAEAGAPGDGAAAETHWTTRSAMAHRRFRIVFTAAA
jgi:hypothetical protein